MATKHKATVSSEPSIYRLSAIERRAARTAEIASQQGELKREAAERRARRASGSQAESRGPEDTGSP
jgi:hypothetical protein